jgi:O-antigen/teichoic acid export membrane protein
LSIARNIFLTFNTNISLIFLGVLYSVVTTRLLGPGGKGEFALFTSTLEFTVLFFTFGTHQAVRYYLAGKRFDQGETLSTIAIQVLGGTVLYFSVLLGGWGLGIDMFGVLGEELPLLRILLLTVGMFSQLSANYILGLLHAYRHFKEYNLFNFSGTVVAVLVYGTMFVGKQYGGWSIGLDAVLITHSSLLVFNLGLSSFFLLKKEVLGFSAKLLSWDSIKAMYRWGLLGNTTDLVQFFNYRLDFWIVEHFHGKEVLGPYSNAFGLSQMFRQLPSSISLVLFSHSASKDSRPSPEQVAALGRFSFWASMVVALVSLPLLPYVVWFLYGDQFVSAAYQLMIIYIGLVPRSLSTVFSGYFAGSNRVDLNLHGGLIALVLTLCFDLLWIPHYGAYGAAGASAVAYLANSLYLVWRFRQMNGLSWKIILLPQRSDWLSIYNKFKK